MEQEYLMPDVKPVLLTPDQRISELEAKNIVLQQSILDLEEDMLQLNKHMAEFRDGFKSHVQFDLFEKKK